MVALNSYGATLDSGGTPNAKGSLLSISNFFLAVQDSGTSRVRYQIEWYSIERAVQTTSATAVSSTGSATITLASVPANFTVGTAVLVDKTGANQETVTITAQSGSTITATFAKTHSGTYPVAVIPQAGDTPSSSGSPARVAAYDWTTFDDFVTTCTSNGLYIDFVLQNAPVWHQANLANDNSKNVPAATDAATFATDVMNRAATKSASIYTFEVANEGFNTGNLTSTNAPSMFNQMYTLLSAVRTAVKAVDPTPLIGAPAELNKNTSNISLWTAGFCNAKCHTLVDYVNFHFYPGSAPDSPTAGNSGFTQWIGQWEAAMSAAGVSLPIWVTEWGWTMNQIGDTNYNAYLTTVINDAIASGSVNALFLYDLDSIVPAKHFNDTQTNQTYKTWKNFIATTPVFGTPPPLTFTAYLSSAAATTLPSASQLYVSAGSPTTTNTTSVVDTASGFGEVTSQGTTVPWANAAKIPAPTGKGFLWDVTTLEGNQFPGGTWEATLTLVMAGAGAATVTADIHCRTFKYHAGTYTQIAHMIVTGQAITTTNSQFVLSASPDATTVFATGEKLYGDTWLRITVNPGVSPQTIRLSHLSTDTVGKTGDPTSQIVTPGYQPATVTPPPPPTTSGPTLGVGPYTVTIDGIPVNVLSGSLSFGGTIGRRSQASFTVFSDTTVHFQQYQQVAITDATNMLVFNGYITQPQETKPGFQNFLLHSITCCDQHFLADKRVLAASYTNRTIGDMVQDIVTNVLSQENVAIGQIFDGLVPNTNLYPSKKLYPGGNVGLIPQATFVYCSVAQALDELVKAASASGVPYYWMIDQNLLLWFVPYTATVNLATIDGTQLDQMRNPPKVTRANPTYRNTEYIVGGVAQTVQQTETRKGDSNTVAWTMGYALNSAPTITVNGVGKSVGIKGLGTGNAFYWAQGDPVITQDSGATKLVSTDTLQVVYIGQYPTVIIDQNNAQVAFQANLDNSSGIIEHVQSDQTITTITNGLAEASQLLTRYAQQGTLLECMTLQPGFAQGQLVTVDLPSHGIYQAQMLLSEVIASDGIDGYNIWYTITAVQGPYDTTWVDFFSVLLKEQAPANSINIGVGQSVQILAAFTASINPSATLTVSVYACPLPGTSQFPSTTLFPC